MRTILLFKTATALQQNRFFNLKCSYVHVIYLLKMIVSPNIKNSDVRKNILIKEIFFNFYSIIVAKLKYATHVYLNATIIRL